MSTTLKIRDESTLSIGGDDDSGFLLEVPEERITVRDLIRARVYREVRDYNLDQPEYFQGLIQPSDAERSLNGFKMRRRRRIDPDKQFELAKRSFYTNGFILLVDDRQVDESRCGDRDQTRHHGHVPEARPSRRRMNVFLRRWRIPQPYRSWIDYLVAEQRDQTPRWYTFDNKDSAATRRILEASKDEQRGFVLAAAEWLDLRHGKKSAAFHETWVVRHTMQTVLRRRLSFDHDDVCSLLDWSIRQPYTSVRGTPQMIKALQDHLKEHELTPDLRKRVTKLTRCLEEGHSTEETRRWVSRLRELGGLSTSTLPLVPGEAWSDAAIRDIEAMQGEERGSWVALLQHCTRARGAKPTQKWSKQAEAALKKIERPALEKSLVRWFPLVDKPRTRPVERGSQWQPDPNMLLQDENADILKALAWLCAGSRSAEVARALGAMALSAYRKVPQMGPRCVRLGNACVWALGAMPDAGGVGQLAMLRARVKFGAAQKGIEKALDTAAGQAGMPLQEIEEISVPTYGLQEVGVRREQLGRFGVELVVTGTSTTELRWIKPDGKRQKSVPKAVKEHSAEQLKEIKSTATDMRKMLPAQRDRIENLYLEQMSWNYSAWHERYLDHPLVGTLARRLIWKFTNEERSGAGVFYEGRIVGRNGHVLNWLDDSTSVELWHPMQEDPGEVLAWRDWLDRAGDSPALQAGAPRGLPAHRRRAHHADLLQSLRRPHHPQHQFDALCARPRLEEQAAADGRRRVPAGDQ